MVDGFYYPDLHFMHEEFEDLSAPWNNTVPDYFGFGYVSLESEVRRHCHIIHVVCVFIVLYTLYVPFH